MGSCHWDLVLEAPFRGQIGVGAWRLIDRKQRLGPGPRQASRMESGLATRIMQLSTSTAMSASPCWAGQMRARSRRPRRKWRSSSWLRRQAQPSALGLPGRHLQPLAPRDALQALVVAPPALGAVADVVEKGSGVVSGSQIPRTFVAVTRWPCRFGSPPRSGALTGPACDQQISGSSSTVSVCARPHASVKWVRSATASKARELAPGATEGASRVCV